MSAVMLSLVVKVTIILVLGLAGTAILRQATSAFRHVILLGTLVSALLLPALIALTPAWKVGVFEPAGIEAVIADSDQTIGVAAVESEPPREGSGVKVSPSAGTTVPKASPFPFEKWSTLLAVAWLFGSLAVLGWLTLGHLRLRSLTRRSWLLDGNEWIQMLREERHQSGVEDNVHLLCNPDVSTPLTWGSFNPVIMLPEDALEWSAEHRRIVLRHELAHVARKDALAQLAAGVACAIYWFHPLVWIAERKLRAECERACDDRVVASGTSGPIYATHLLEVARSARSFGGPGFLSVAMARPSQLEGRLLAVLNESRPRAAVAQRTKWLMFGSMVAMTLVISAFRPVESERGPGPSPKMEKTPVVITAVPAVAVPVAIVPAADSMFERSTAARLGGTLTLDLKRTGGTITITGWDRAQVLVRARLGGPDWRESRVTLESLRDDVVLRDAYIGRSSRTSFSHSFDIRVPRNFNVRLNSAGGGISITGVEGRFSGTTGGGEIRIDNAQGEIDLQSGGGDINVTNSNLRGVVSTGAGTVNINGGGSELVGSSGSGEIIGQTRTMRDLNATLAQKLNELRHESSGITTSRSDYVDSVKHFGERGIQRHRSGGDITLAEAPNGARVITGGGAIRIGPSGGEVYASTGGGAIEIGPATGSVIASTGAGSITLAFRGAGPHAADLTSGLGRIELILPENINAELLLETAYTNNSATKTRIESDWPLAITETDRWDASVGTPRKYVRARHTLGTGGELIRVRTVNGNVIVRKADSP